MAQAVVARVRVVGGEETLDHRADRGVADRVDRDLPAAGDRGLDRHRQLRGRGAPQARVVGSSR